MRPSCPLVYSKRLVYITVCELLKIKTCYCFLYFQISESEEELIVLILKNSLVPKLVHTWHYPVLIQYVLANQNPEVQSCDHLSVERLAGQLKDCGFDAEAGSLLLQARAVHPVLQTFGSAMTAIHKWFK